MNVSEFNFDLPQELIAQDPLEDRSSSRLLVLDKETGDIQHKNFRDLLSYLRRGDCLVVNDTKVIPARLYGVKEETEAKIEVLLLKRRESDLWETLVKPGKRAKPGTRVVFGEGLLLGEIVDTVNEGNRLVRFTFQGDNIFQVLDQVGRMPLPPYITEELEDGERYQTVYSRELGSAAAPTAGLHFTPELLATLREKGIETGFVTLHVGLGTFRPVKVDDITNHHMHSEFYTIPEETAQMVTRAKQEGRRVIAVGTTSCRTLESAWKDGALPACSGDTSIFIYPGYQFQVLDGLITNFHLPESTLIMLVSAFAGYRQTMNAYQVAVRERYRFFSFGDSSIIL